MPTTLALPGFEPLSELVRRGIMLVAPQVRPHWGDDYMEHLCVEDDAQLSTLGPAIISDARACSESVGAMVGTAEREVLVRIAESKPDVDDLRVVGNSVEGRRERARRKREMACWLKAMDRPRVGLDMTSGQSSLVGVGHGLSLAVGQEDVDALITGEKRKLLGAAIRLWDVRPYAYRAAAPDGDPMLVAAAWLAWRAIVATPLLCSPYASLPPQWEQGLRWQTPHMAAHRMEYVSLVRRDSYGYGDLAPAGAAIVEVA